MSNFIITTLHSTDMNTTNWRAIAALNIVSALAQLGQFGVGFLVLPIWLAARGVGAVQLGLFGAFEWAGMLLGLLITPKLLCQMTSKIVIFLGLVSSTMGFLLTPLIAWPIWLLPAFLIGFGVGLRWIANETWLYRISPQKIVGQIVGVHEALIALAVIIGPLFVVWLSSADNYLVWLGALFSLLAALPLLMVTSEKLQSAVIQPDKLAFFQVDHITKLGVALSATGGVIDGAINALFPIFGLGRGLIETQIASLLIMIGIGNLLMQYPLGWSSDKFGVIKTGIVATLICVIITAAMAFIPMKFYALTIFGFVFGGTVAAYLTLGIIAAASAHDHQCMAQNMSKVSIAFTVSSIIGALLAGFAAHRLGSDALLWLVLLVSSLLLMVLLINQSVD